MSFLTQMTSTSKVFFIHYYLDIFVELLAYTIKKVITKYKDPMNEIREGVELQSKIYKSVFERLFGLVYVL